MLDSLNGRAVVYIRVVAFTRHRIAVKLNVTDKDEEIPNVSIKNMLREKKKVKSKMCIKAKSSEAFPTVSIRTK